MLSVSIHSFCNWMSLTLELDFIIIMVNKRFDCPSHVNNHMHYT